MQPATARSELFDRLAEIGRQTAGTGEPDLLYDRHGVLVVRVGDVVVKAHQADRDGGPLLGRRMETAAAFPDLLLPPIGAPRQVDGRVVTLWPYGVPVAPANPPWEDGGQLLARLHLSPVPPGAPPWGRPTRVVRVVSRMPDGPAATEIRRAFATLPDWIRGEAPFPPARLETLVHGDWHLGQLVSVQSGWRMIDIEDLGLGDPAWDLARPAALYAAGVLYPEDWAAFLGAYQAAGGPAVPIGGDPWTSLDIPARTLSIQIAATCVISAREAGRPLDEAEQAVVDTCRRISRTGDPA